MRSPCSTPKQARSEVLERASLGENISYSKAKSIVDQHKKTAKYKSKDLVTVNLPVKSTNNNSCKSTESLQCDTLSVYSGSGNLTEKKAETETCSLSSQNSLGSEAFEDKQIVTTIEDSTDDDNSQIPSNVVNLATISYELSDSLTSEMASRIKHLTPEQLALAIIESAQTGLSDRHLKAIITASQQALYSRSGPRNN